MAGDRIGRRAILSGLAIAASAGCLGGPSSGVAPESTEREGTTSAGEPGDTTGASSTVDSTGQSDFYLVNSHSERVRMSLRVGNDSLGRDEFLLPGSTGVVFEAVAEVGSTYPVSAAVGDEFTATGEWSPKSCDGTEAPDGNTDGGIEFVGDELRFRQNACDAIFVGTERLTYEDPDEYRV